jgi:hypothetical protein
MKGSTLGQVRIEWEALVNEVMKFRITQQSRNILTVIDYRLLRKNYVMWNTAPFRITSLCPLSTQLEYRSSKMHYSLVVDILYLLMVAHSTPSLLLLLKYLRLSLIRGVLGFIAVLGYQFEGMAGSAKLGTGRKIGTVGSSGDVGFHL